MKDNNVIEKKEFELNEEYIKNLEKISELFKKPNLFKEYNVVGDFKISFKVPTIFEYGVYLKWLQYKTSNNITEEKAALDMSTFTIALSLYAFEDEQFHEHNSLDFYGHWLDKQKQIEKEFESKKDSEHELEFKLDEALLDLENLMFEVFEQRLSILDRASSSLWPYILNAFQTFSKEFLEIKYFREENEDLFSKIEPTQFFFYPEATWEASIYNIPMVFSVPSIKTMKVIEEWCEEGFEDGNLSRGYFQHIRGLKYLSGTLKYFNNKNMVENNFVGKPELEMNSNELKGKFSSVFKKILYFPYPFINLIEECRKHLEEKFVELTNGDDLKN